MNADNVIPFGKFTHEVAQQGGVNAYKAATNWSTYSGGIEPIP